ncbi:CehA/McbA family metallohydrolase [Candidatus Poribacteria bacterium]
MATLKIQIKEGDNPEPTPARVHLMDSKNNFHYPEGCVPYKRDNHFTIEDAFEVSLPDGNVSLLVEKGKEYSSISGQLVMRKGQDQQVDCELYRWVNMAKRGWYSGDLHIHRPLDDMAHLILAEDLNAAPDITVWNKRNDWINKEIPESKVVEVDETHAYGILTQEDERGGGAVMVMNPTFTIDLEPTSRWYPANFSYCLAAHEMGFLVDQEKPFWWETPVNVALGGVDTIGIINNHMQRETMMDNEAWGKPRDMDFYPGYQGFVENVLDLYYRYLNLGLKIPISAGSASGVLRNPVGYNRLYVHLGHQFSYDRWLRGMKSGRAFATNGPMLFFSIDRHELGETLEAPAGQEFHGRASLEVVSQAKLDRVEILYNGEVIHEFSANNKSKLTQEFDISLDSSGWVAARAFEKNKKTVRFAHTNPIYIEIGSPMKPRKDDAVYYRKWCQELLSASLADRERYVTSEQRDEVETLYRRAATFYRELAALAE